MQLNPSNFVKVIARSIEDERMEQFQKDFICLIRAALTNKTQTISSAFDWKKALYTAEKHNIGSILFYGAVNCNIFQGSQHMRELYKITIQSLMVSQRQIYELEQVEAAFEKENIDFMPLKGVVLKTIYPNPEMRAMGDADILIKYEQNEKIERVMEQLGFEFQYESDHELVWKKNVVFVELHKSVMTTYNKDFYNYYGSGWTFAKKVADCSRHEMSAEDFYVYIFVHFTKHYRISGIGIKHLLDLWMYVKAHPDLNWKYIMDELEKMKLSIFHYNIEKTLNVWFNGDCGTEATDLITNIIFDSGQYGSNDVAEINRALQNGKDSTWGIRFDKIFKNIFLPYQTMKEKYQILKKVPYILPVMWIVRCFDVLFRSNKDIKRYVRKMKKINSKQVQKNKQALRVVGLDFNLEE